MTHDHNDTNVINIKSQDWNMNGHFFLPLNIFSKWLSSHYTALVTWPITWCITVRMAASLFHMITNHSSLSTRHGSLTCSNVYMVTINLWIVFYILEIQLKLSQPHRVSLIDEDVGALRDKFGGGEASCLLVSVILHSIGYLIVIVVFWVITNIREPFGRIQL